MINRNTINLGDKVLVHSIDQTGTITYVRLDDRDEPIYTVRTSAPYSPGECILVARDVELSLVDQP